jgi:hypothetical protein
MNDIKRWIEVTFQREGIHKYPAALEDPNLADVSFLGYPHRHMFHFRVRIAVTHNDRDIEFIQFKRWLEALYSGEQNCLSLDYKSCEMIAEGLMNTINARYPGRAIMVQVFEDGENGAILEWQP